MQNEQKLLPAVVPANDRFIHRALRYLGNLKSVAQSIL